MRNETVLRTAEFNPKVKTYWLLTGAIILVVCVITIPLAIIWFFVGGIFAERYLRSLSAVLTDRNLHIKRGIWFRLEKTVPLEKITDLGQHQGPLMRYLDLKGLSVETAGQSGPGALVRLIGIVGPDEFRDAVLDQREKIMASKNEGRLLETADTARSDSVFEEIRDSLQRIEKVIAERLPKSE